MNFSVMMQVLYDLQRDVVLKTDFVERPGGGWDAVYFGQDGLELYRLSFDTIEDAKKQTDSLAQMSAARHYSGDGLTKYADGSPRYVFWAKS